MRAKLKDQEASHMQSTNRIVRKSRRSRRKGPVHFVQGLFLQIIGFVALITVMLGLGRDNWFLTLITSPVSEAKTESSATIDYNAIELPAIQFPDTVPLGSAISVTEVNSEPGTIFRQSTWNPTAISEPYLGHNSPWTSHH